MATTHKEIIKNLFRLSGQARARWITKHCKNLAGIEARGDIVYISSMPLDAFWVDLQGFRAPNVEEDKQYDIEAETDAMHAAEYALYAAAKIQFALRTKLETAQSIISHVEKGLTPLEACEWLKISEILYNRIVDTVPGFATRVSRAANRIILEAKMAISTNLHNTNRSGEPAVAQWFLERNKNTDEYKPDKMDVTGEFSFVINGFKRDKKND